jgi:putative spermidine/putrescine transport system permease protein
MGERLEHTPNLTEIDLSDGRASEPSQPLRGLNRAFHGRRKLGVASTLGAPLAWMLFVYLGSLVLLVFSAFYKLDPITQKPSTELTLDNIKATFNIFDPAVRETVWVVLVRTVGVALAVTVCCFLIALPVAFFVSKVAWRGVRRGIIVAMLMPLWAGYLVKGYAWRAMVAPSGGKFAASGKGAGGFLEATFGWTPGYGRTAIVITLVYFWLPYMVLPIYAGLDRMPSSLLDAAGDLGARPMRTFRSVIFPLLLPAIAAGSIFTFSLSLGDYIVPQLVNNGKEKFMFGQLINSTLGAPNQPLAAAYTLWPLLIVVLYLLSMKRLGAFENL